MYSVVMLMAMTTATETPSCGRPAYYGCYGCYGGWYSGSCGWNHGCRRYYGGCGWYSGCYGYYSPAYNGWYSGVTVVPQAIVVEQQKVPAAATIQVSLPADAKLFVDGRQTTSQGENRSLETPPLQRDKEFTYTLTATVQRNNKEVKLQKQVSVSAGRTSHVSFDLAQEVVQK